LCKKQVGQHQATLAYFPHKGRRDVLFMLARGLKLTMSFFDWVLFFYWGGRGKLACFYIWLSSPDFFEGRNLKVTSVW
jgi:hypothetical protein